MLRRLYDRVIDRAASPHAEYWLAAIALAEASFFPIAPDTLLVPMVLARPQRAWRLALICTLASVAGGALGWLIGHALFDRLALPLLRLYHDQGDVAVFQAWFARYGLAVILIKGLTPIPYKVVSLAAGAAAFNFPVFLAASLLTRGARFFLLAALLRRFGPAVQDFIQRRLALVATGTVAAMLLGLVALRFL